MRAAPFALLTNSRTTECAAKQFLAGLVMRAAPFALLTNSRTTECAAKQFLAGLVMRAAPFALLINSRKTECGAHSAARLCTFDKSLHVPVHRLSNLR
jgi:hypothetical protein